jgi:hypothetical protein
MSNLISGQPMDRYEAKAKTDTVKRDLGHIWHNLAEIYQRQGHLALGYATWHEYMAAEFDIRQSRAYQLLDAGRVIAAIEAHSTIVESPLPANEAVARELTRVDDPAEAWRDVVELNGDKPTAKQTRAVVQERTLKNPATDKQLSYLGSLAQRRGASLPDKPISKNRASKLIDHMRDGHACECRHCGRRMA